MIEDEIETAEKDAMYEKQDKEIETLAREKLGPDATDNQIESFKEEYLKDKQQEDYIYNKEFNMMQPKEGFEILEVGDDYGEMEQGTENEGDGVSVYTEQEWMPHG